jgi:thioesterase domain-containing protein
MANSTHEPEVLREARSLILPIQAAAADPRSGCTRSSAVVRMKGGEQPSLFLFPGSIGSLLQLAPLAAHIELPIAIYGVKPKGSDPGEMPFECIEDMAQYAMEGIRRVDGEGPYLLAGFSAGGLVALEVACRLSAAGSRVPFLALLDTYPSEETWPIACHLEVLGRQLMRRSAALVATPLHALGPYIKERIRGLRAYMWRSGLGPQTWQRPATTDLPEVEQRLHNATAAAHVRYVPSYYAGTITFFRASEIDMEPSNPRRFLRKFAQKVEIFQVPGSHMGMVELYPEALAARLSLCLERVLGEFSQGTVT